MKDQQPAEQPTEASLHFQVLLSGTLIFLIALFWLEVPVSIGTVTVTAIRIVGCYLAFVSVVIGHKMLAGGKEKNCMP